MVRFQTHSLGPYVSAPTQRSAGSVTNCAFAKSRMSLLWLSPIREHGEQLEFKAQTTIVAGFSNIRFGEEQGEPCKLKLTLVHAAIESVEEARPSSWSEPFSCSLTISLPTKASTSLCLFEGRWSVESWKSERETPSCSKFTANEMSVQVLEVARARQDRAGEEGPGAALYHQEAARRGETPAGVHLILGFEHKCVYT